MPMYDFHCKACGRNDVAYRHVSGRNDPKECDCGAQMERVILAPSVQPDLPGYQSPVTGKWVEGRVARREDLKASGCRPYEGREAEVKEANRVRVYEEQKSSAKLQECMMRTFYAMPAEKRRMLTRG